MKRHPSLVIAATMVALVSGMRAQAAPPVVERVEFNARDVAAMSGMESAVADDVFVLHEGEQAWLMVEGPAAFAFRSVGCWWQGSEVRIHERVIRRDGALDREYRVYECEDLAPEAAGATGPAGEARVGSLVHVYGEGGGRGVEVRLEGPMELESLAFVFIGSPAEKRPEPGDPEWQQNPTGYPKPPVNSTASWGADPPACNPRYCTTTHLGVHHTASASEYDSNGWSECASNVKSTQAYHMYTRGWCDIGYNYLICVHGQIWEGRDGGDDVIGAHDGYNCGSMGVSYMGYFHAPYNQTLNAAMLAALGELGAWKCDQQGIDPWGSAWYSGYGGTMRTVYGHRDVGQTTCPGDLAYAQMDTMRGEIADRLNGGGGGTEIILDTPSAGFTQSWTVGTSSGDKYGSDYRWRSTGIARGHAYWRPTIEQAGYYRVFFWWPAGGNRNPETRVGVRINGVSHVVIVNQQVNGGKWNEIGTWWMPKGTGPVLVGLNNDGPNGYVVVADAVRLVKE